MKCRDNTAESLLRLCLKLLIEVRLGGHDLLLSSHWLPGMSNGQ